MCPYPGKLTEEQKIFNYGLSRARRVIENAFDLLVASWRIFHTAINATVEHVESYVQAAVASHNYLGQTENTMYCQVGFIDSEAKNGDVPPEEWRLMNQGESSSLADLPNVRGSTILDINYLHFYNFNGIYHHRRSWRKLLYI